MKDIIVITGPTGVGKTKLSVGLAKLINAEVINGDSVQIYNKLNIGSAKTTKEEMDGVKHHLFDIKEPNEFYTVYDYQKDSRNKIEEILNKGKKVIIVGGTGLYIKACLYDYKFNEEKDNIDLSNLSNKELYLKVKDKFKDIELNINNRNRLERYYKRLLNNDNENIGKNTKLYDFDVIGLTTSRDNLYNIINKRVDKMISEGLLAEVQSLKDYYNDSHILNNAIGYKEFKEYLNGNIELDKVIENIKKDSRHFAKRQYTFFNHQFDNLKWFETNYKDFDKTIEEVYKYIDR